MLNIIFGIIYLIFGLFKLLFCLLNIITSKYNFDYLNKNKILKYFISNDLTNANKLFFIIIGLYAFYTFIKGLKYTKLYNVRNINRKVNYYAYLIFGLILIILYSFIVYTPDISNKIISRDNNYMNTYKNVYLVSGVLFLITMLCSIIINDLHNINNYNVLTIIVLIIILINFIFIIGANKEFENQINYDVATFIMIPLGSL